MSGPKRWCVGILVAGVALGALGFGSVDRGSLGGGAVGRRAEAAAVAAPDGAARSRSIGQEPVGTPTTLATATNAAPVSPTPIVSPTATRTPRPSPSVTPTAMATASATPSLTKSDDDPGVAGADIETAGGPGSAIAAGESFAIVARYVDESLRRTGTSTSIQRAFVLVHQPDSGEWIYLYVDRLSPTSAGFTAWAYSPYPETARGANDANPLSQRLTADGQLEPGVGVAPSGPDAQALLTRTRLAFTVDEVRLSIKDGELQVRWQLTWGAGPADQAFPAGRSKVYAWVQTPRSYDGWDQVASIRLVR